MGQSVKKTQAQINAEIAEKLEATKQKIALDVTRYAVLHWFINKVQSAGPEDSGLQTALAGTLLSKEAWEIQSFNEYHRLLRSSIRVDHNSVTALEREWATFYKEVFIPSQNAIFSARDTGGVRATASRMMQTLVQDGNKTLVDEVVEGSLGLGVLTTSKVFSDPTRSPGEQRRSSVFAVLSGHWPDKARDAIAFANDLRERVDGVQLVNAPSIIVRKTQPAVSADAAGRQLVSSSSTDGFVLSDMTNKANSDLTRFFTQIQNWRKSRPWLVTAVIILGLGILGAVFGPLIIQAALASSIPGIVSVVTAVVHWLAAALPTMAYAAACAMITAGVFGPLTGWLASKMGRAPGHDAVMPKGFSPRYELTSDVDRSKLSFLERASLWCKENPMLTASLVFAVIGVVVAVIVAPYLAPWLPSAGVSLAALAAPSVTAALAIAFSTLGVAAGLVLTAGRSALSNIPWVGWRFGSRAEVSSVRAESLPAEDPEFAAARSDRLKQGAIPATPAAPSSTVANDEANTSASRTAPTLG